MFFQPLETEQINATSALIKVDAELTNSYQAGMLAEVFSPYIKQMMDSKDFSLFHIIPFRKQTTADVNCFEWNL